MAASYSILVDSETSILLGVGPRPYIIEFLRGCSPDNTRHIPFVQFPNYQRSLFLRSIPIEEVPQWTWDEKGRLLVPTNPELLTEDIKLRSYLTMRKFQVLRRLINNISTIRNPLNAGVNMQEVVHLSKRLEAQRFKDRGYEESHIKEYPYTDQYAYMAKLSPEQSADEILFAAKLAQETLIRSEGLRLKYFRQVKEAQTPEEMPLIWKNFSIDVYRSSLR